MLPRVRAREVGIAVGTGEPAPLNALTDVSGVRVGHTTLIEGESVRTGVSVMVPTEDRRPVFAGFHRLNGNGEVTGTHWIRESGLLTTPIGLTNTHSVGVVRDALVAAAVTQGAEDSAWDLPVVAETWDGILNDVNGFHVRQEHVLEALANTSTGDVAEGSVGGGTGMICHGFKGGIGTASRVVETETGAFTLGVLVQANHGRRDRLTIEGAPVGRELGAEVVPLPTRSSESGSIIVVVATDAPLLPHQCDRLAQRAALGIARTGGAGEDSSGDFVLCFATGNRVSGSSQPARISMLPNEQMNPLFYGAIEATEEAILNALLAAETMTGRGGATAHGLDSELLVETLRRLRPDSV
jgi:D-aminopeptidase